MSFLIFLFYLTPFSADRVEIVKQNNESVIHLIGNVIIEDSTVKITCDEARLYEVQHYVVLDDRVTITDANGTITAGRAVYNFRGEKGYLTGGVLLITREEQYIQADSLYYNGSDNVIEMFNHIKLEDKGHKLIGYGGQGFYDLEKEQGHLLQNPRIEIIRTEQSPIKITAVEFQLLTRDNVCIGQDSVVTVIDSFTAYCDTLIYNYQADSGSMVRPLVIEKNNQLHGEKGEFCLREQKVESFSVSNGWSKYYTDEGSENVVEGEKITILFRDSKAVKIVVEGKPRGVITLKNESSD